VTKQILLRKGHENKYARKNKRQVSE